MGLTVKSDDKGVKVLAKQKTSAAGNTYTQYSVMISSKDANGDWHNGFMDCAFKKGVTVADKEKIIINNAFFTVSEYNGKTYTKLFITDFSRVNGDAPNTVPAPTDDWMNIPDGVDDALPFN